MKCGRRCGENISVHNTPASASTAGGELVAAAGWEVRQHGGGKAVDARGQEHRQQGQEVWQHIDAEAPSRAGELMTSARKSFWNLSIVNEFSRPFATYAPEYSTVLVCWGASVRMSMRVRWSSRCAGNPPSATCCMLCAMASSACVVSWPRAER